MSSIFSDPPFPRGTTLLGGEEIELSNGVPVAGTEIVGQVKAFQDQVPTTLGQRLSNRLVYCVAARYKGTTVPNAATVTGRLYVFDADAPLSNFSALATEADVAAGKLVGVLDEYLTGAMRQNDIVWLVVKGPTSMRRENTTSTAAAAPVEVTGTVGRVQTRGTGTIIGNSIAGAAVATGGDTLMRVNKHADQI